MQNKYLYRVFFILYLFSVIDINTIFYNFD
jgi:hypothetical protein